MRSASGIPPSISRRGLWLLAIAAGLVAGCGLLPDPDRSPGDRAETLASDSEDGPPPASPDGGEGGAGSPTRVDEEARIRALKERIEGQIDSRPRTTTSTIADALAEGAVLVGLAALVALVASLYRHHRPGLTLAVSVLGLLVALAAFVNSAV